MERNSPDIEPAQESSTLARSRLRKTVRAAISESVSALSGLFRTSSRMTREGAPGQVPLRCLHIAEAFPGGNIVHYRWKGLDARAHLRSDDVTARRGGVQRRPHSVILDSIWPRRLSSSAIAFLVSVNPSTIIW
jgi:hypothetical protein